MKKIFLLCVGSLFTLSLSAQIKFDKLEHDFGTLDEGQQGVFKFTFKNVGKTKTALKEVRASCGCTTPQYTRKEIAPNDTGSILVSYNSKGRPGMFTKTVTVVYDTAQAPIILQIKGDVKSAPVNPAAPQPHNHDGHNHDGHNHNHDGHDHQNHSENNTGGTGAGTTITNSKLDVVPLGANPNQNLAQQGKQANPLQPNANMNAPKSATLQSAAGLPINMRPSLIMYNDTVAGLAFENLHVFGQNLSNDKDQEFTFRFRNVSPKTINILDKTEAKACFKMTPMDRALSPGQESSLKVKYIASKAEEVKLTTDLKEVIAVFTDEVQNAKKNLVINGTYQKKLTPEEIANGPKLTFANADFEAGEILAGEELVHKYQFTNTGKSDLVIESAKASCGCTVPELKEKLIKPGQASYIEAKFNSTGRSGPQHKTITVVSNDPSNPRITLNLKCTVKEDPFGAGDDKKLPLNDNSGRMGGGTH